MAHHKESLFKWKLSFIKFKKKKKKSKNSWVR